MTLGWCGAMLDPGEGGIARVLYSLACDAREARKGGKPMEAVREEYLRYVDVVIHRATILPAEVIEPLLAICFASWLDTAMRKDTIEEWCEFIRRAKVTSYICNINNSVHASLCVGNMGRWARTIATERIAELGGELPPDLKE